MTKSHVPSPTVIVSDEYDAEPGGDRPSAGAILDYCAYKAVGDEGAVCAGG